MKSPRSRELGLGVLAGIWLALGLLFAAARFWVNLRFNEPLWTPGAWLMLALLLGLAWLAVEPPEIRAGQGRRLALALLGLALLASGQFLLWLQSGDKDRFLAPGLGLLLSGAALLAFLAGRGDPGPAPAVPRRTEILLFALVFLAALAARAWKLGELPGNWWYDEINLARVAQDKVLAGGQAPLYVAENVENPGAYLWAGAAVFKFFGVGVGRLRALSAFFGLLALFPFYFLARRWLGAAWALAALALFACMRWTLIPQRIAFMSGFALFWTLSAFYFFWQAFTRRRTLDFAAFGACLGATFHAYTPTRLVTPVLLLFLAFHWRWFRGLGWRHAAAFFAAFSLVAGPMVQYMAAHWDAYTFRSKQVSIMNDVRAKGWGELWTSFYKHLLMFNFRGDHQARHNLHFWPHVDFLSAAALAPAWAWFHARFARDARATLLSLWFWAMLSAGIFSMTVEAPQGHRTILLAPLIPLAVALFAGRCLAPLGAAFQGGWPFSLKAAGLAALLAVPAFNLHEYFVHWARHPATWRSFSPEASTAARRAMQAPPGWLIFASGLDLEYQFHGYERNAFLTFFLRQQGRGFRRLASANAVSEATAPDAGILAIWGESDAEITRKFKAQFPDLKVEEFRDQADPKADYLAAEIPVGRIPRHDPQRKDAPLFFRP